MRRAKRLKRLEEAAARGEVELPKPRARSITGGASGKARSKRRRDDDSVSDGTPAGDATTEEAPAEPQVGTEREWVT